MIERKSENFSPPALGGSSLLVVFAVLALTVFALLSLSTVRADVRLGDAAAQAVSAYYAADCQAQEILARLRSGEMPEEAVWINRGGATYVNYNCSISDTQDLKVSVRLDRSGSDVSYTVVRWQAVSVGAWNPNDQLDVWDGG